MKTFRYVYKTSQGIRQTAEMSADTRDEVFAALRGKGIRPIKVVAADGSKANGEAPRVSRRAWIALGAGLCLGLLAATGPWIWDRSGQTPPATGREPHEAKREILRPARPLARQVVSGDRMRIANPPADLFPSAAERYLARFAEPGRPLPPADATPPAPDAFLACLQTPLRVKADEFTEYVELVRIVTRIKEEMRAYLAGGGSVGDYLAELVKRQRLEISYREQAERKLEEYLDAQKPDLPRAYDYWLKANARLRSMGIYTLPLPDRLRAYELTADLDE